MKNLFYGLLILLLVGSGCKEDSEDPTPIDPFNSSLEGKLADQNLSLTGSAIQHTYFSDQGENTGALEVGVQLPNSERLTFFIHEVKEGTITLSQEFPAVMGSGSYGLRKETIHSNQKVSSTPPSFVKYTQAEQTYFAISGKYVISLDGNNLTFTWEVTFKDTSGNTFTAKGSTQIKDYRSNQRPRSEINSPASNLSISSISPDYGPAGTEVTLTGTGFSALKSENALRLGDLVLGEPASASATELKISVPENGNHGKFYLSVLGGNAESAFFFYAPILESADKSAAKVGEEVVLSGKHFDADPTLLEVKVGEKNMEILSSSLTTLTFKISEGTQTGKITVARKGKPAVEGPELSITTDPVTAGPPINEIFEVISGDLNFEEVLINNSEYGPFWTFEIDRANHKLYAVGSKGIVEIDLTTRSTQLLVDANDQVYTPELGTSAVSTLPQAVYPDGKGNLYGVKSPLAAIFAPTNIFKIALSTQNSSMIGNTKINAGGIFAGMYVSEDRIFLTRAQGGYDLLSFDLNMEDAKTLLNFQSKRASELIPMGGNRLRLLRDQKVQDLHYSQVDGTDISGPIDWSGAVESLRPADGGGAEIVGMEYLNGDFIGMFASSDEEYTIGIQAGETGNFVKKGEFILKQTYLRNGNPTPILAYEIDDTLRGNVLVADKNGDLYILLQTPTDAQGNFIAGALGGIYKVSF